MRNSAWIAKLGALILKESKQIVRDPSSWIIALALPIILLLFFGYALSLDTSVMKIAIINEGNGAISQSLTHAFVQSPSFNVYPAASRQEATKFMADSEIKSVLIMPSNFDALLNSRKPGPVQLLVDGSEPNGAKFMRAYVEGLAGNWDLQRLEAQGLDLSTPIGMESIFWYNTSAKSRWSMVPGSITVVMSLIGIVLTSLVITREWERGTMEALFASPVTRMQIFLSKLLPYYCLGMISLGLCTLAAIVLFKVPYRGSLFALFSVGTAFMMPSLGQGLLISSVFRSQLLSALVGFLSGLLPAMILSGLIFDINSMPWGIQLITYIIPARYFNVSMQTLFLAGDIWHLFVINIAYMAALGTFFFVIAYRNIVKRLD